jgi:RNA polymerase sigma-70 factor, ECF subfamily
VGSDETLVARVAAGDDAALEELLRRYERALAAYIHRRTHGTDVEDLYQETWMRVVRGAAGFDVSRRFSSWLFQIATNLCRDWWRRKRPEETGLDRAELNAAAVAPQTDVVLTADALLATLPDAQREALVLRYYHDASEAEMSEILGCPPGTVKSRIHNALARLSALVRKEES